MRKLVLIAHISLDGFVAGPGGELDGFDSGTENLEFVCRITEEADTALFGRVSYQLLNSYWPGAKDHPQATKAEIAYSSWYNNARKIVISRTMKEGDFNNTTVIGDHVADKIVRLKEQAGKDILIFGSPSVSQLMIQHELVDDYWIFVNPVIFGKGIPLFAGLSNRIMLELKATKQFPNGEVALHYTVKLKIDR